MKLKPNYLGHWNTDISFESRSVGLGLSTKSQHRRSMRLNVKN